MWTPKRLGLLLAGFAIFFSAYEVYHYFLGKYDGLPPLPEEHRPRASQDSDESLPLPAVHRTLTDKKLVQAFGPLCEELQRQFRFSWNKGEIVLAADDYQIVDGQLHLTKVSMAFFGKPRPDRQEIEINTVRGDRAKIRFDQPIKVLNPNELGKRKPVDGRLEADDDNGVQLQNNRRTSRPDDDLRLFTKWLAYNEAQRLIWTDAAVRMTDGDPFEGSVTAVGMEVLLDATEPAPKKAADKPSPAANSGNKKHEPRISGVRQMKIKQEVRMIRMLDAGSGFLGAGQPKPTAVNPIAANNAKAEKSQLTITSGGPFVYDFAFYDKDNDRATFFDKVEVLRTQIPTPRKDAAAPEAVPERPLTDELFCDRLVIRFRHNDRDKNGKAKPTPAAKEKDEPDERLSLVSVHALGEEVVINSEAEALHAVGGELLYEAAGDKLFRTTLRGKPEFFAVKEGSQIKAHGSLVVENKEKEIQSSAVYGPGKITVAGRKDQSGTAEWQKEMRMSKDGKYDQLIFTGGAVFNDAESRQMKGNQVVVWLEPPSQTASGPRVAGQAGTRGPQDGQRLPKRVHALGQVSVHAPEITIPHTDRLAMEFENIPSDAKAGTPQPKPAAPMNPPGAPSKDKKQPSPGGKSAEPAPKKPRPPLNLSADSIDVQLIRQNERPDLKEVWAQGQVCVSQQPLTPEDKVIDIAGERLQLSHSSAGDVLQVFGGQAQVQLDKLFIIGPDIKIDQRENVASVKGIGTMKYPVLTDMEGNKLKQALDLIIHWKEQMYFNGSIGEFAGNVQAEQGDARLWCQRMQVLLDRPVSFKERQPPGGEQNLLSSLVCGDDLVRFTKGTHDGKIWREYRGIEGTGLTFSKSAGEAQKQDSSVLVSGPGVVRLLQLGPRQMGPQAQPKPGSKSKDADQEMKLTYVTYDGRMEANQATNVARFYERVEVINLPADDPEMEVSKNKLPPRAFWMRCDDLAVRGIRPEQKAARIIVARKNVRVESDRFQAEADVVKYDEAKEQLIFEAADGNWVTFSRQLVPGGPFQPLRVKKLFYFLKDNTFKHEGLGEADFISGTR